MTFDKREDESFHSAFLRHLGQLYSKYSSVANLFPLEDEYNPISRLYTNFRVSKGGSAKGKPEVIAKKKQVLKEYLSNAEHIMKEADNKVKSTKKRYIDELSKYKAELGSSVSAKRKEQISQLVSDVIREISDYKLNYDRRSDIDKISKDLDKKLGDMFDDALFLIKSKAEKGESEYELEQGAKQRKEAFEKSKSRSSVGGLLPSVEEAKARQEAEKEKERHTTAFDREEGESEKHYFDRLLNMLITSTHQEVLSNILADRTLSRKLKHHLSREFADVRNDVSASQERKDLYNNIVHKLNSVLESIGHEQFFKNGGIVLGKLNAPVRIIAHQGEIIVPKDTAKDVLNSEAWHKHIKRIQLQFGGTFKKAQKMALKGY